MKILVLKWKFTLLAVRIQIAIGSFKANFYFIIHNMWPFTWQKCQSVTHEHIQDARVWINVTSALEFEDIAAFLILASEFYENILDWSTNLCICINVLATGCRCSDICTRSYDLKCVIWPFYQARHMSSRIKLLHF